MFIDVKGFEKYFQINHKGEVLSKRTNRILKQGISKTGYPIISTKIGGRNGKAYCLKIHRLMALTFLANPNNLPEVNHIDGNKLNNNLSNLEWISKSNNIKHAHANNLISTKGENHPSAKITVKDVNTMREDFKNFDGKKKDFYNKYAQLFNLYHGHIKDIVYGRYWDTT